MKHAAITENSTAEPFLRDAYCAKKYRSYDRHSRTYMEYDGLRHSCQ